MSDDDVTEKWRPSSWGDITIRFHPEELPKLRELWVVNEDIGLECLVPSQLAKFNPLPFETEITLYGSEVGYRCLVREMGSEAKSTISFEEEKP